MQRHDKVDLIFHVNVKDSLKAGIRMQGVTGKRLKVPMKTMVPGSGDLSIGLTSTSKSFSY